MALATLYDPIDLKCDHFGGMVRPCLARWLNRIQVILFVIAWNLSFDVANACPVLLKGVEMQPFPTVSRHEIKAFAVEQTARGTFWKEIPLQIDPLDRDGDLIFFQEPSWRREQLTFQDRIALKPSDFGPAHPRPSDLPCTTTFANKVTLKSDPARAAWIMGCRGPVAATTKSLPSGKPDLVQYQESGATLTSNNFTYAFNKKNQMLFESIVLNGFGPLASKADLSIRSDVKKFFTLNFDSSDVESYIELYRTGPVAVVARVSFYLKILFFKIKLALMTDVSFFDDAALIPMFISLPKSGRDHLHPGSGMIYSWKMDQEGSKIRERVQLPEIQPQVVRAGYQQLAEVGRRFCEGDMCRFGYGVVADGKGLQLDFGIRRRLVEMGLFPQLVRDINPTRNALDWRRDRIGDLRDRRGLYLETSGLEEGEHQFDLWLRIGQEQNWQSTCPTPALVSGL